MALGSFRRNHHSGPVWDSGNGETLTGRILVLPFHPYYSETYRGLVIPCLLPVTIIAFASPSFLSKCGKNLLMPLTTPK